MKTRLLKIKYGRRNKLSVLKGGSSEPLFLWHTYSRRFQNAGGLAPSKACRQLAMTFVLLALTLASASAQNYSIDWHKIAGGGGTSTNGQYSMSGTIGQHDAGGPMTGGNYSLTGGFWSLISVVQTPGLPNLTITHSGNSVKVSWPDTGSYTLQQTANLAAGNGGWVTTGYTIATANGTNSITITPPTGNLFFRLKQ